MMYWIILIFHIVIMPLAAFHALVYKRDHRAALGWMGIILLFPIIGALFYFIFGINRLKSKAKLFSGQHLPFMSFGFERASEVKTQQYQDPLLNSVPSPELAVIGGRVSGVKLSSGNSITALINGEEFFPHLIESINSASQYVLIATYLFGDKGVGGEVVTALSSAAKRGIQVHVLIDGVGSLYSLRRVVKPLKNAGVHVALFLPPRLLPFSFSVNLRNHRKIAVIDGERGYFGGANIDQRHMVKDAKNKHPTEDVHFFSIGSIVNQLQNVFLVDWYRTTQKKLSVAKHSVTSGDAYCRTIDDGPGENLDYLAMTLHGVFAAAKNEILIMMPYFIPSREMIAIFQAITLRGVKIKIVLPENSNLRSVDWACRNMLWELLVWGVEVYFKPAPFAHTKLIAVDNNYVMVGSANLDARSLRLNFELGVEIFSEKVAFDARQYIENAIQISRRVALEELDQRPILVRARDAFFWLFSSYL